MKMVDINNNNKSMDNTNNTTNSVQSQSLIVLSNKEKKFSIPKRWLLFGLGVFSSV